VRTLVVYAYTRIKLHQKYTKMMLQKNNNITVTKMAKFGLNNLEDLEATAIFKNTVKIHAAACTLVVYV
jgi:hypothetical protein